MSLIALTVLLPLMLVLMVLGAIKMKGNPFFTQLRPGKDGKIFKLIKFRSMTCEKDKDGNLLPDDVRLTRYGEILRSTSLDELPELLNILKGDMSFVGPRPLIPEEEEIHRLRKEKDIYCVRPGLTGYAQVNGRDKCSIEEKVRLDREYIDKKSLAFDIKIFLKTFVNVFTMSDVVEGGKK